MFASDRILYVVIRGSWCNIIVLNEHAPSEEKGDDSKHSICEELEQVFNHFPKCYMKILLGYFNGKVGRENIFKPTIRIESLHQNNIDNGVRIINFANSKNLVFRITMLLKRDVHNYSLTSPYGKTHNQIDHILIDRRLHSSILDVRNFSGADCDTDYCLVAAIVKERLAVMKEAAQKFDGERFNVRKLNELEVRKEYQIEITNRFVALVN